MVEKISMKQMHQLEETSRGQSCYYTVSAVSLKCIYMFVMWFEIQKETCVGVRREFDDDLMLGIRAGEDVGGVRKIIVVFHTNEDHEGQ